MTKILDDLMGEHVPYEIMMLRRTSDLLAMGIFGSGIAQNAFIEAFAVHARALTEFFNGKKGSNAKLFTNDEYVPFSKGAVPTELTDKLNQQISHITEKRFTSAKDKLNGHDIFELRRLLDPEIAEFLRCMRPDYRAKWDSHKLL